MGWSRFWIRSARREAKRRRQIYGLEPPGHVSRFIGDTREKPGLISLLRLIGYILFGTPGQQLKLFWRYLTDRDTPKKSEKIILQAEDLKRLLSPGSRVIVDYFERRLYSRDVACVPAWMEKLLNRTTPLIVAQPRKETDIAAVLRFAARHYLPVFPRGVSSSAFGGSVPTVNGITLDLSAMTEIFEVNREKMTVNLQCGVRWGELAEHLAQFGLAPLTTPTSRFSTVAGWVATGGLGIDSFAYGHVAEAIEKIRVVLPDNRVIEFKRGQPGLREFFGTEGQFGIISELTLRVKKLASHSSPVLLTFENMEAAFAFTEKLAAEKLQPTHLAFLDPVRMEEENLHFKDRSGNDSPIVSELDSLLLHFDDLEKEQRFKNFLKNDSDFSSSRQAASYYMWSEIFFPLKFQRLGPGMLAAEVKLPANLVPEFIRRARRLARRFGSKLAIEAIFSRIKKEEGEVEKHAAVVIASFRCDPGNRLDYLLRLLLVQLIVYRAIRLGGRPYGFGIWNTPFLPRSIPRSFRKRLVRRKLELDPGFILNPRKFFRVKTRFFNIPGIVFSPSVFWAAMSLLHLFSPVVGGIARVLGREPENTWSLPSNEEENGLRLLRETAARCTFCGACVSNCPAYLLTTDERVTARGKLRMSEVLKEKKEIQRDEFAVPFQCLRCSLCEEVCQTGLPLTECYPALENWVEQEFGRPEKEIERFIKRIDDNREWLRNTFGLIFPEWSSRTCIHPIPRSNTRQPEAQHD
ncbi:FAD-binding protein [Candidatus Riflebacteria bacterium]